MQLRGAGLCLDLEPREGEEDARAEAGSWVSALGQSCGNSAAFNPEGLEEATVTRSPPPKLLR